MERLDPLAQGDMGTLHDRSDHDGELLAASITLEQAVPDLLGLGRKAGVGLGPAMRTYGAFRPSDLFQDHPSFILRQPAHVNRGHFRELVEFRRFILHLPSHPFYY